MTSDHLDALSRAVAAHKEIVARLRAEAARLAEERRKQEEGAKKP